MRLAGNRWHAESLTEESLIKGLFTEVWAGLRCFANFKEEPTYLPSLNRQQMALVLLDPGKNCWGHERTFHRNYDWGVWPQPEPRESGRERGECSLSSCWCFPMTQPKWLGQGDWGCPLQRSASQGQSKVEVGRESERGQGQRKIKKTYQVIFARWFNSLRLWFLTVKWQ